MSATPERIFQTLTAFQQSAALKGAIDLELFTAIDQGANTVPALTARCGGTERSVRILCDYLTVSGFLTKSGDTYGLAADSALFLVKDKLTYLGTASTFLCHNYMKSAAADVAETVRRGTSILDANAYFDIENQAWVDFAKGMMPMMIPAAQYMATLVDAPERVLDVAAGHGIFGILTAQKHPATVVDALDWPSVLEVAAGLAAKFGVADRWNAVPGSAFEVELTRKYDAIYVTNFYHHFDPPTCVQLAAKWKAALKPGGQMITVEMIPDPGRVTPPMHAAFPLVMLLNTPAGDAYTFAEYDNIFRQAGFASNVLHQVPGGPQRVIVSK
ncbi:MAG: class I SAM-dependent methyltransferase [Acidobacteria bacterium]|nr:class I SAM-dependent methyltransferase [Acidobacteriota bacterium]